MSVPGMAVTHGSPPYHESAFRAALRAALASGSLGAGLGAVPRGANFGTAFAAAAGGASKAYQSAQQAAQEYALKQAAMQSEQELRDAQKTHLEALAQQGAKPQPPIKKDITNMSDEEFGQYVKRVAAESKAKASGKPVKPPVASSGGGLQLSDAALNGYAKVVHEQGIDALSRLGFGGGGKAPLRVQILNRHAELYPEDDLATIGARYKGTSSAITKMDQNRAFLKSYGPGALAAMDEVEQAMKDIPDAGNRPMNYVLRHLAAAGGSPAMSRFQQALPIAQVEFSRIIAQPNLTGMLTNEQLSLLRQGDAPSATKRQMHAAAKVLRYLYTTRKNALDTERANLVGSIGDSGTGASGGDPLGIR